MADWSPEHWSVWDLLKEKIFLSLFSSHSFCLSVKWNLVNLGKNFIQGDTFLAELCSCHSFAPFSSKRGCCSGACMRVTHFLFPQPVGGEEKLVPHLDLDLGLRTLCILKAGIRISSCHIYIQITLERACFPSCPPPIHSQPGRPSALLDSRPTDSYAAHNTIPRDHLSLFLWLWRTPTWLAFL